jgi:hypothetical protein
MLSRQKGQSRGPLHANKTSQHDGAFLTTNQLPALVGSTVAQWIPQFLTIVFTIVMLPPIDANNINAITNGSYGLQEIRASGGDITAWYPSPTVMHIANI